MSIPVREFTDGGAAGQLAGYGGTWGSCGIGELYGLHDSDPERLLAVVMAQEVSSKRGFSQYVFTDNFSKPDHGGPGFANFIKKHKLGDISGGVKSINKNTGNKIAAWIWIPDRKAIAKYLSKVKK